MNKIGQVALVVGLVTVAYLLLLVTMPILAGFASTCNTTVSASSNMTNYPGTLGAILAAPWALFFVPGTIGIVVIIAILKKKP